VSGRARAAIVGAWVAGALAGGVLTLTTEGGATDPDLSAGLPRPAASPTVAFAGGRADTFLVWMPGGLPATFSTVAAQHGVRRLVVVSSDVTWLTRSFDRAGSVVDDPPRTFAIPLEVAAVDPRAFAPFLPPGDRRLAEALADGEAILGETSARLRHLGVGATLRFGDVDLQVAGVLPDELVGANEVLVSRRVGRSIGVTHPRYALVVPDGSTSSRELERDLRGMLPAGALVQVRASGETPYFRQGDAVLPQVVLKTLFGEFAAKPDPARPGYLVLDPAWVRTHIATERVPLLGDVTCNAALFPQIRGVVRALIDRGLDDTISSFSGCFSPRRVNRIPTASISHHTWGIALDLNVPANPFGAVPDQDPRLVRTFERWGFVWGGSFVLPDGMHFEYRRPSHRSPAA